MSLCSPADHIACCIVLWKLKVALFAVMHRWRQWIERLELDLANGRSYSPKEWAAQELNFTLTWAASFEAEYEEYPRGSTLEISQWLFDKYADVVLA